MSLMLDPSRAIEQLEVQVQTDRVRWLFPLAGIKAFIEINEIHPLPPPTPWDGLVRIEDHAYCLRILRDSRAISPELPLKGCVIEKGKIPVVLAFERFMTGTPPAGFVAIGAGEAPFSGVIQKCQLPNGICYRIDTVKLIV